MTSMNFERIFSYLLGLELNNRRDWFHQTHDDYVAAKADFEGFVGMLQLQVLGASPVMGERLMMLPPKSCIYRIMRDMRYVRDGRPYNPWFSAYLTGNGKNSSEVGFYVRIQPGGSCLGTGMYSSGDSVLTRRVRRYLAEHADEWEAMMADPQIREWFTGDKLKRVPKEYSPDHPQAEWLKYKSWSLLCPLHDDQLNSFEDASVLAGSVFAKMEPFRQWMDAALNQPSED